MFGVIDRPDHPDHERFCARHDARVTHGCLRCGADLACIRDLPRHADPLWCLRCNLRRTARRMDGRPDVRMAPEYADAYA